VDAARARNALGVAGTGADTGVSPERAGMRSA